MIKDERKRADFLGAIGAIIIVLILPHVWQHISDAINTLIGLASYAFLSGVWMEIIKREGRK